MNREKLLEVANAIENAPPEQFHLGSWFGQLVEAQDSDNWEDLDSMGYCADDIVGMGIANPQVANLVELDNSLNRVNLTCNTTACIAGWTVANQYFMNSTTLSKEEIEGMSTSNIESLARLILDLNGREAYRLFFYNDDSIWREVESDYGYGHFDDSYPETWNIHAKHAADVLRRIANGDLKLDDSNDTEEEHMARWGIGESIDE
ncbi:MAG: hypothetical protein RL463_724 [Bacteroidota bacterium]|jgi:hypothetical protein